jgi:predicted methyltransferase
VIAAVPDEPGLPEYLLDAVLIADAYHEIVEPNAVIGHLLRALKPGGKLVVIDYIADSLEGQLRERQTLDHTISPEFVVADLQTAGFQIEAVIDSFNANHPEGIPIYAIVATRN